ncbi:MAG: Gfo/Idh/MocA family oxidoreductase [Burkholderiales bacterium]|nr:Gfo/Idh/MocA family oxidoreductase [Opitutaceae bacterium]
MTAFPPSPARSRIRWGILGCGDVTEVKSGPALQKARGSELVAVMRRDSAKAADYARRHGVPRWYDDALALVSDPEVDAIYVATPPGAHVEGALLAAAAGKPCYVEKPFARSTVECDTILEAFRATNTPVFVAYYRRCLPRFEQVAELLAAGELGRLTGINVRYACPAPHIADPLHPPWRLDAANAGGGLFLDLGSHTLDLLDHLLGPLTRVQGHAASVATPLPVEDAVAMSFATEGGLPGVAAWDFASALPSDEIIIAGTAGRLVFSTFGNEPVRLETRAGVREFDRPHPSHVQQPLIQTVVDALLGRGECPSTGENARRTSAVMDAVLESYYGGRSDAFWTRPDTWPGRRG